MQMTCEWFCSLDQWTHIYYDGSSNSSPSATTTSECVMILRALSLYSAHGYQVLIVSVNDT